MRSLNLAVCGLSAIPVLTVKVNVIGVFVGIDFRARRLDIGHKRRNLFLARVLEQRHLLQIRYFKRILRALFGDFVDLVLKLG